MSDPGQLQHLSFTALTLKEQCVEDKNLYTLIKIKDLKCNYDASEYDCLEYFLARTVKFQNFPACFSMVPITWKVRLVTDTPKRCHSQTVKLDISDVD